MTVTAEIDVTRPVGRKLVRDLESKKCVKMSYPVIGKTERTYSHKEVWKMGEDILNEVFGTTNIKFN